MRFAQLTALSVAIAASALAVSLSSDYMASIKPQRIIQVAPKIAMTKVVTAANPIAHGRIIKMEDLKEVEWPADLVPEGAFLSVIQVLGTDQERVALSTFTPGEVVTRKRVSAPGQRPSLALMLGPGMRAIAVRVNAVLGVGGFVMPGHRVDLLLTETVADDNPGKLRATEVLLRNVRVLAIDQQTEGPEYKPRVVSTVTLEVALRDAQKITLATTMGSISLALRSIHAPRDEKAADDIVKEQPPIPQPVAEKKTDPMRKIVVFRSAKPTEYKVPHVAASILR